MMMMMMVMLVLVMTMMTLLRQRCEIDNVDDETRPKLTRCQTIGRHNEFCFNQSLTAPRSWPQKMAQSLFLFTLTISLKNYIIRKGNSEGNSDLIEQFSRLMTNQQLENIRCVFKCSIALDWARLKCLASQKRMVSVWPTRLS